MPTLFRQSRSVFAVVREGASIGLVREEQPREFLMTVHRRGVKWRPSSVLPRVGIGAVFQKQFHDLDGTRCDGAVNGVHLTQVLGRYIGVGITLEQQPHDLDPVEEAGQVQGRKAIDRSRVDQGWFGVEKFLEAPGIPQRRCLERIGLVAGIDDDSGQVGLAMIEREHHWRESNGATSRGGNGLPLDQGT